MSANNQVRDQTWEKLYRQIVELLSHYGVESATGDGEFWVVDDDYGWYRHTVNVFELKMLNATIIGNLCNLLRGLPKWEIVMALDVPGKENIWPHMGLTIREHEIIDGLARSYLPEPYRSMVIPNSRPGTGYD